MKASGLRFEEGTKLCGLCKSSKDVIQFERNIKRDKLPIVEIAFICKPCAIKQGLLDRSEAAE
jgi:hypothetical protein